MTLGDIERHCLSKAPEGFAASATEDYDGIILKLFTPDHRTCGFMISRLQLANAIDPHALLDVLTREAVNRFDA